MIIIVNGEYLLDADHMRGNMQGCILTQTISLTYKALYKVTGYYCARHFTNRVSGSQTSIYRILLEWTHTMRTSGTHWNAQ